MKEAGYEFEVVAPQVGEGRPTADDDPRRLAEENARLKARDVAGRIGHGLVLAADTLVSLGDKVIGKPKDKADALRILKVLSGTCHSVITGVALIDAESGRELVASEETFITMRDVPERDLRAYVDTGESMGKAGAYAIQEKGDRFVERIEGSFSNVVGLPLELVARLLKDLSAK